MENTFGCWSGNVPPVHSTACDWYLRASPLAVMLCHCWQWLHYYSKPEDASGFELLIQLLSKEGKKSCLFLCSKVLLCFSLLFCFCAVIQLGIPSWLRHILELCLHWFTLCHTANPAVLWLLCYCLSASAWEAGWEGKKLISCTNSQVRTCYEQRQKMEMQQSVQGASRCITPTGELKSLQRNLTWTL